MDYMAIVLALMSGEIYALKRNWTRWKPNEYNHQFDHNIGIGNLKEVIYSFLILTLFTSSNKFVK